MTRLIILSILFISFVSSATAQNRKSTKAEETSNLTQLSDLIIPQIKKTLLEIPVDIKRVAVFQFNQDGTISGEESNLIRFQIENLLIHHFRLDILKIEELEPNNGLKIIGNDSTFIISNATGKPIGSLSNQILDKITNRYDIDGLIELTLSKTKEYGVTVAIRIIRPENMQVIYSKTFYSYDNTKPRVTKNNFIFSFATSSLKYNEINDVTIQQEDMTSANFQVEMKYLQSNNKQHTSYFGLGIGYGKMTELFSSQYDLKYYELSCIGAIGLTPVNDYIGNQRILLSSSFNIKGHNAYQGILFSIRPQLDFQLSKTFGLSLCIDQLLGNNKLIKNGDIIYLNNTSYGLSINIIL